MPETGASGSVGAPLEQSEGATRQQDPPYGLPHLFRFALELASTPLERSLGFVFDDYSLVPCSQRSKTKGFPRIICIRNCGPRLGQPNGGPEDPGQKRLPSSQCASVGR